MAMTEHEAVLGFPQINKGLHGRSVIYSDERIITPNNVVDVLQSALAKHNFNRLQIDYLYRYVRGVQPIIERQKKYNAEICNRIVVNRANEIVTFKTANFIGEPLQYVSRGADESTPGKIELLNSFMMTEDKASKDMELAFWMHIVGIGYRLILNDKQVSYVENDEYDEAPFEIYTLDPRNTFVVHWSGVTKEPVMGVNYVKRMDGIVEYTVYTKNVTYVIENGTELVKTIVHNFGRIPIVEYPCNQLRMGSFEVVIDLLDAINNVESDRIDGVDQFIQALMVFENVEIDDENFDKMKAKGAIQIFSKDGNVSKVYYLNEHLDQKQTQILIDDLWQIVLSIVGMPSQGNANTSDSSNNGAIMMKNGWSSAESRAKETDGMWKQSENEFLKIICKICRDANAFDLKVSEIEQKFGRRSYEDLITKTQAFTTLIGAGCTPLQAFTISGVVVDPESSAITYEAYNKEKEDEMQAEVNVTEDEQHSADTTDNTEEEMTDGN